MKHRMQAVFLLGVLLLTACGQSEGNLEEEQQYYTELTEEERNQEHLSIALMEDVQIDAEITPYERYQKGINVYLMEWIPEGSADVDGYLKNPTIFGKNTEEVFRLFEEQFGGSFAGERTNAWQDSLGAQVDIPYTDNGGEELTLMLDCFFSTDGRHLEGSGLGFESKLRESCCDRNFTASNLIGSYQQLNPKELQFADSEEAAGELKEFLEELTGRVLSEDYRIYSVDLETAKSSGFEEEFYVFTYYYSVDGFPWRNLSLSLQTENYPEELKSQDYLGILSPVNENTQMIGYDASGLRFLEIDRYAELGEVCEAEKQVVSIDEILTRCKEYFNTNFLKEPVVIFEVKLVYSSYFVEDADGELKNAVCPFWICSYVSENTKGQQLIFDAFTGDFIRSNKIY